MDEQAGYEVQVFEDLGVAAYGPGWWHPLGSLRRLPGGLWNGSATAAGPPTLERDSRDPARVIESLCRRKGLPSYGTIVDPTGALST